MKHKNGKALSEKISKLTESEFSSLVKRCSSIYQEDLCFLEDIRIKFVSFDFIDDDAWKLWKYLEAIVEEFHGDAEKYYMNFYDLLHELLLPQKFEGDITVTSVLLSETANHLLIYSMQGQEVAQMISKMIVLIMINQPYQNERLKAYSILLDMLFTSFIKDSNLQKRGIRIHTTSNAY